MQVANTTLVIVAVTCVLVSNNLLQAGIVADYRDDYADDGNLRTGWRYLWNAPDNWAADPGGSVGDDGTGAITDVGSYTDLIWTNTLNLQGWTADGDDDNANSPPARFLKLTGSGGGHPGLGASQNNFGPHNQDRYVIAAYTIQAGDGAGTYSVINSNIRRDGTTGATGIEVLVMVDGTIYSSKDVTGTDDFDTIDFAFLNPGQTIYVAIGPDDNAGNDGFSNLDFSISVEPAVVPEPSAWAIFGGLVLCGSAAGWWRQRRKQAA